MEQVKYPNALANNDKIAICAFSSGVASQYHQRLDIVLAGLAQRGFEVIEGACLRQQHNSAKARADELMAFLTDDSISAIMPPWGGDLTMEILPLLDFNAINKAKPKWLVGFSDISTFACALTTRCGWATIHSANLMQCHPDDQDPYIEAIFQAMQLEKGQQFSQTASSFFQQGRLDYAADKHAKFDYQAPSQWRCINYTDNREIEISGRLIGGCLDTLALLLPSKYYGLHEFKMQYAQDGLILYLENVELSPAAVARCLLSLKLSDVFTDINGILFGRSPVSQQKYDTFDYYHAIELAFKGCLFPVIVDADIGHIAPNLVMINGGYATLTTYSEQTALSDIKLKTQLK